MSIVTPDGGLTTAGYALCIVLILVLLLTAWRIAVFLSSSSKATNPGDTSTGHTGKQGSLSVKRLTFCAAAMALAFVTSYIKVGPQLPFGGSVTLMSMLFICLIGYWYGSGVGFLTGLAYGILQFIQEPYVLSFFQVCCDYVLAFAGLGLAGLFRRQKHGLLKGYLLGILARGAFHTLGGYLYWMDYMPENFPQALAPVYPIVYNYSYILAEGVLTVIVILLPPVAKALRQIKHLATE